MILHFYSDIVLTSGKHSFLFFVQKIDSNQMTKVDFFFTIDFIHYISLCSARAITHTKTYPITATIDDSIPNSPPVKKIDFESNT